MCMYVCMYVCTCGCMCLCESRGGGDLLISVLFFCNALKSRSKMVEDSNASIVSTVLKKDSPYNCVNTAYDGLLIR